MYQNKIAILGFVYICFLNINFAVSKSDKINCNVAVRCTFEAPRSWATDGNNCMVFFNSCHLRNHNCERLENGAKILNEITREQCLKYCRPGCTRESNPVCTDLNGNLKTFENPCLWSQEMCTNGETYVYQFQGKCQT